MLKYVGFVYDFGQNVISVMYMEEVKCVYFIGNVFYDTSNSIVIVNKFFMSWYYMIILYIF